ncbi:DUF427 domain-containing protein [Frankia sp. EI5c]|uniref:DUF427 domain-containing protein n=1 Tax=Frankia sp. EI5c TaxID=683316 RepID=UPI00082622D3|nr:DUF427 domain-containing protein [Frankia sp. EI5c]
MSLTLGTGPFARHPAGAFNFDLGTAAPAHVLYLDDVPGRIRAEFAGRTVLDTRRARALYETNYQAVWYVPLDDIRRDLLEPTDHQTFCPFKGTASYWTLRVGDRVEENVLWSYPAPVAGAPPLAGLAAFYFDRLDAWYQEDERVFGHPKDPYHRVDIRRSSDQVEVTVGGELVARTSHPVKLFETSLPPRWYVPLADVRPEALVESATHTVCPYKGEASYYTVRGGGQTVVDGAWYYPRPLPESTGIAGYVSFLGEGISVLVDGEPAPGT